MFLEPMLERMRFLVTDTILPDFEESTVGRTDEEVEAAMDIVKTRVEATRGPESTLICYADLLPILVCDKIDYNYITTMAAPNTVPTMDMFASPAGTVGQAKYASDYGDYVSGVTALLKEYVKEQPVIESDSAVTRSIRQNLVNAHLWMSHPATCLRIWPGSDVAPYPTRSLVKTLDMMMARFGPAMSEVSYDDDSIPRPSYLTKCFCYRSLPVSILPVGSLICSTWTNVSMLGLWTASPRLMVVSTPTESSGSRASSATS